MKKREEKELSEKLLMSLKEKKWVTKKTLVILAFSGGGDSVSLFHVLNRLKKEINFSFLAVHVNHGIRGEEADRDENFCRKLCDRFKTELNIFRENAPEYAEKEGVSLEDAGRRLRYKDFRVAAQKWLLENPDHKIDKVLIALAHHANDQEETVLMNFFRGSGLRGLSGIRPLVKTDDILGIPCAFIRPFLSYTHDELLTFLKTEKEEWCEDATNQEADCVRNELRLHLIPEVKQTLAPSFTKQCERMAEMFSELDEYLEEEAEIFLSKNGKREANGYRLEREPLLECREAFRKIVLRSAYEKIKSNRKDLSYEHTKMLSELVFMTSGKMVQLPNEILAMRQFDSIFFFLSKNDEGKISWKEEGQERKKEQKEEQKEVQIDLEHNKIFYRFMNYTMQAVLTDKNAKEVLEIVKKKPDQTYTKWFDCDKITSYCAVEQIRLRYPEENDILVIHPSGQKKSLMRYLQQARVPVTDRKHVVVLAAGNQILWIPGMRTGEGARVDENSQRILEITIQKD